MKKILVFLCMVCCCVVNAGNIRLVSGSVKNIRPYSTAVIEFNFESATWEELEDFKDFCGDDYDERVRGMTKRFIATFNQETNKLSITKDTAHCDYKIIVDATNFERKVGGTWGRYHIRWYGTISIVDLTTNTVVCKMKCDKIRGDNDFVPLDRLIKCYRELASELAHFLSK